jgi:hypothetical protein
VFGGDTALGLRRASLCAQRWSFPVKDQRAREEKGRFLFRLCRARRRPLFDPGSDHDQGYRKTAGDKAPLESSARIFQSHRSFEHGVDVERGSESALNLKS